MQMKTVVKRKLEPDDIPKTLFAIKGKPAWYAWLKEYADSVGLDVTVTIDNALRHQARRDEFTEPMPRRFGR
jgi:hypothetical protein